MNTTLSHRFAAIRKQKSSASKSRKTCVKHTSSVISDKRARILRKFLEQVWASGALVAGPFAYNVLIPQENLVGEFEYFNDDDESYGHEIQILLPEDITYEEFLSDLLKNKHLTENTSGADATLQYDDEILATIDIYPEDINDELRDLEIEKAAVKYSDGDLLILPSHHSFEPGFDVTYVRSQCTMKQTSLTSTDCIIPDDDAYSKWLVNYPDGKSYYNGWNRKTDNGKEEIVRLRIENKQLIERIAQLREQLANCKLGNTALSKNHDRTITVPANAKAVIIKF